jgi:hypothetical protein
MHHHRWQQPGCPPGPTTENMPNAAAVRWYRGRDGRMAVIVSLSMLIPAAESIQLSIQDPAARLLVLAAAVPVCAWFPFAVLLWRAGIGVTAEHLIVRTALGRQQLVSWPSVAGFGLGAPKYMVFGGLAVYVIGDDGRRLCTRGCSFNGLTHKRDLASARRMLRMLEMERQSHISPVGL